MKDVPLKEVYPGLGIDRALALWGAGRKYGFPCLVIDGGTALTFTGADGEGRLIGGAIVPGFKIQLESLGAKTDSLPIIELPDELPSMWARETGGAIGSGIVHTMVAGVSRFIDRWLEIYPDSSILLTGGDGKRLGDYLYPLKIKYDPDLIFIGMGEVIRG